MRTDCSAANSAMEPTAGDVPGALAGVAEYVTNALQDVKDAVVGEVRNISVSGFPRQRVASDMPLFSLRSQVVSLRAPPRHCAWHSFLGLTHVG